jgi:hypothetical protein
MGQCRPRPEGRGLVKRRETIAGNDNQRSRFRGPAVARSLERGTPASSDDWESPEGSCDATRRVAKRSRASGGWGSRSRGTSAPPRWRPPRRRVGHHLPNQQRFPAVAEERRHEKGVDDCVSMSASERPTRLVQTQTRKSRGPAGLSRNRWRSEPSRLRAYAFAATSPTSTLSNVTKSPGA